MIDKIMQHVREGTLIQAFVNKLKGKGSGYVDPDHYHGETARDYLKKRLKQEMWHREQQVVQELINKYPDGIRVLDVPFGTGRFVDMLLKKEATIYGIDISADMLSAAKEELGEKWNQCSVIEGSADDLPYEDNYFDLAICFRFFGLIPLIMARNVLKELHRTCREDVIIRVPIRKVTNNQVVPLKESELMQGRMSHSEIRELFLQYGFKVESDKTVGEREEVEFVVFLLRKV